MKAVPTLVVTFLLAAWLQAQTSQKLKPTLAAARQDVARKDPPTLGFNHIKDVSPIADEDAFMEELRMEKELPDNPLVYAKRALHEAGLMNEFKEGFKNSKECSGITFYLKTDKKADFTVQIMVSGHDGPKGSEQSWTWILSYLTDPSPADKSGHGMGGMGIQSNAKLTA